MYTNCPISFIAEIATIASTIIALVSMIYTIRVYKKANRIQKSVEIDKVEAFTGSLISLKNFVWDLSYHLDDGIGLKELRLLEQKSRDVIEQIDRYQLLFPDSIMEAQDNLKKQLRDCVVRCQEWSDYKTDYPDASVDEYLKRILETIEPNTNNLISEVITGFRHSKFSKSL